MKEKIKYEISMFFKLTDGMRRSDIALLSSICIGLPLIIGYLCNMMHYGVTISMGGFVILYLPTRAAITNQLVTLLSAGFGIISSALVGLLFSYSQLSAVLAFGLFTFVVHLIVLYYKASPPRSFFFVMVCAIILCSPHNAALIPQKIGLITIGVMFSLAVGALYILFRSKQKAANTSADIVPVLLKNTSANYWEAIIMAVFMAGCLALGYGLNFSNPYWIAVSCAAVMQGASRTHIWRRTAHRLVGTFIGLGLSWIILSSFNNPLVFCVFIAILQYFIERLVSRHYALAVIFITPLAILLAELVHPSGGLASNTLMLARFYEICIGCFIGAFGGWLLHKEKIRYASMHGISIISGKIDQLWTEK